MEVFLHCCYLQNAKLIHTNIHKVALVFVPTVVCVASCFVMSAGCVTVDVTG